MSGTGTRAALEATPPESWSGAVLPGGATTYYRLNRLFQGGTMTREAVDTLLAEENSGEALSSNDIDVIMEMLDTRFRTAAPGKIVEVQPSAPQEVVAANAAMDELGVPELSGPQKATFDSTGYLLLRQVITPEQVEALRGRCAELLELEGIGAGREVHQESGAPRLSALNHKGPEFDPCSFNLQLLSAASYALDGDVCCNNINYRDAIKGHGKICPPPHTHTHTHTHIHTYIHTYTPPPPPPPSPHMFNA